MDDRDRGRDAEPDEPGGLDDILPPVGLPPDDEAAGEDRSFTEDIGRRSLRDADAGGPGLTTMEDPEDVPRD